MEKAKRVLLFLLQVAGIVGLIGGCGYCLYHEHYFIAVCVFILGLLALPTIKRIYDYNLTEYK